MQFEPCVDFTFAEEGGFVVDDGGPTNFGIRQITLARWRNLAVSAQAVRDMTRGEASQIYFSWYFVPVSGPSLASGLDLMVFDHGVNAGPVESVVLLQSLLGVARDGLVGPRTLAAVHAQPCADLIVALGAEQQKFYRSPALYAKFQTYGAGWMARLERRTKRALAMCAPSAGTVA